MRIVLSLSLLLSCWSVLGQQFSFKLETVGFAPSETITISKYHGKEELPIDSVRGSGNFKITMESEFGTDGLYLITASRSEMAELIINSNETGLVVKIDKSKLKSGEIETRNSPENEAYQTFVSLYLQYEQAFYHVAEQTFDRYDPKIISKLSDQTGEMEASQLKFNLAIDKLMMQYPNTFTSRLLCPLAKRPIRSDSQKGSFETFASFMTNQFWATTDLSDPLILNHFLINECMKNYFRFFVPKNESDMKKAVDVLLERSNSNTAVNNHIRSFLLRNFLGSNANALSAYVNQKSSDGACDLNLSEEEKLKLLSISAPLDTGSLVPGAILIDRDQKMISLSDVYSKSKLTIILFWSANCIHCREELPLLISSYEKFKSLGLEVYSVNLDENKFDWKDYLDQNPVSWINVTDVGPINSSKIIRDFNVYRTPTLYVLNQKGEVLAKNKFGDALNSVLKSYLTPK